MGPGSGWGLGLGLSLCLGLGQGLGSVVAKGYEYVLEPSPVPLPLEKPQQTRVLQSSEILCVAFSLLGGCLVVSSESHLIHQLNEFDSRVVQVVCGQDHSLFRTKKGAVYACGWGADGQTGLGHYDITSVPTKLRGDIAGVNIIQVSSYGDCCLAVSDEGDVFGWGNSEYLQLASVTETTQVTVPGEVVDVACGVDHMVSMVKSFT
ncbi:williams-beuren syndrome chromosomal region 16 hypothetical protein [Limosa lapponica baueri]|uniref:Uncharacterized protein n=1 Tax=Limosa lapponica baueri TaxID=1758121 RepID=A0A2I0TBF6_LIMLA|nr:williams-beuren syndrome chromosomal region 16 hypothetical protein [Limosa lapponica baueri]